MIAEHKAIFVPLTLTSDLSTSQLHSEAFEPQIGDAVYYIRGVHEFTIARYKSLYLHYEIPEGNTESDWLSLPWETPELPNEEMLKDDQLVLCTVEDSCPADMTDLMKWAQVHNEER